jgi:predicted Zn-dependent protease
MSRADQLELVFRPLVHDLRDRLQPGEHLTAELVGEHSQFLRFNQGRVRQIGTVSDAQLSLTLMARQRTVSYDLPLTGIWEYDAPQYHQALDILRQDLAQVPEDPYLVLPSGTATSGELFQGQIPAHRDVPDLVLSAMQGVDAAGFYAGGQVFRGYADSVGQYHWFATDSFTLDYSLFTATGQAVKGTYAGTHWQPQRYAEQIDQARQQLERLAQPSKAIPKGRYRTYFAPAAIAELVSMFSWGGISEAALQQGESALGPLRSGEQRLSPLFTLTEDFSRGLVPRFNHLGELTAPQVPLIVRGELVNTLVNARTAKEYGKVANGANGRERLRSPTLAPGQLPLDAVLAVLDTGLYVSNLHYLNWSDRATGRMTGMTRYACFWVERGQIIAPIEHLRFDESLYRCFGDQLVALTQTQDMVPEVSTYDHRSLGGMWVPGAIVDDFVYTL